MSFFFMLNAHSSHHHSPKYYYANNTLLTKMNSKTETTEANILSILKELAKTLDSSISEDDGTTEKRKELLSSLKEIANDVLLNKFVFKSLFCDENGQESHSMDPEHMLTVLIFLVSQGDLAFKKEVMTNMSLFLKSANNSSSSLRKPSENIMNVMVSQLMEPNVQISEHVHDSIITLAHVFANKESTYAENEGDIPSLFIKSIYTLIWEPLHQQKHQKQKEQSIFILRCISLYLELCIMTNHAFHIFTTGLMLSSPSPKSLMIQLLKDSKDPLMQMSCLELLQNLISSRTIKDKDDSEKIMRLSSILFSHDILHILFSLVGIPSYPSSSTNIHFNEPDPFVGGQALNILTSICPFYDDQKDNNLFLVHFNHVLQNYVHHIYHDSSNETSRISFINAISSFISISNDSTVRNLLNLHQSSSQSNQITDEISLTEQWLSFSSSARTKMKALILNSLANIFSSAGENLSTSICIQIYELFGFTNSSTSNSTDVLLKLIRQPINPEIRLAGYNLVLNFLKKTKHQGLQTLFLSDDFLPFLLEKREIFHHYENTKEGKELKYKIIQFILNGLLLGGGEATATASGSASDILQGLNPSLPYDDCVSICKVMKSYVQQGPHFVETSKRQWDVATE